MLTVSTPANSTALTLLETVKDELQVTGSDQDTYLERTITGVTARICRHLNVIAAQDGTATVGRETLVETFRLEACRKELVLARRPIVSVSSVVEDDDALGADQYQALNPAGLLQRLCDDRISEWAADKIVVTYVAGWLLPGDSGRNLPQEIEDAAIELIKEARFNRARDPALRSENILEGLYSYTLFAPSDFEEALPPRVCALLQDHVNPAI